MEIFFSILMGIMIYMIAHTYFDVRKIIKDMKNLNETLNKLYHIESSMRDQIEKEKEHQQKINESLDSLDHKMKESFDVLESTFDDMIAEMNKSFKDVKPAKPNNWDSVREAFKGPTKADTHSRN